MAQEYDKIFKENIEQIALPLAEKLLGIRPEKLEEISLDLQKTVERKPDFLKKVVHKDSTKDYILHIEFQVVDESKMLHRMLEYYGLLFRKHELTLKQVVFYIGEGKAKMNTELNHANVSFNFSLINIQEINYTEFINSDKPEEVILAILANFENQSPTKVIQTILEKVIVTTKPNLERLKYVKQLEILSILRKLQPQVLNQSKTMALIYNIEDDIRYQQGKEEGQMEKAKKAIKNLLSTNLTHQQIADSLEVPLEFVLKIADSLKK